MSLNRTKVTRDARLESVKDSFIDMLGATSLALHVEVKVALSKHISHKPRALHVLPS
jgi:hypothetical protein